MRVRKRNFHAITLWFNDYYWEFDFNWQLLLFAHNSNGSTTCVRMCLKWFIESVCVCMYIGWYLKHRKHYIGVYNSGRRNKCDSVLEVVAAGKYRKFVSFVTNFSHKLWLNSIVFGLENKRICFVIGCVVAVAVIVTFTLVCGGTSAITMWMHCHNNGRKQRVFIWKKKHEKIETFQMKRIGIKIQTSY